VSTTLAPETAESFRVTGISTGAPVRAAALSSSALGSGAGVESPALAGAFGCRSLGPVGAGVLVAGPLGRSLSLGSGELDDDSAGEGSAVAESVADGLVVWLPSGVGGSAVVVDSDVVDAVLVDAVLVDAVLVDADAVDSDAVESTVAVVVVSAADAATTGTDTRAPTINATTNALSAFMLA
jgi:hypothetical protein